MKYLLLSLRMLLFKMFSSINMLFFLFLISCWWKCYLRIWESVCPLISWLSVWVYEEFCWLVGFPMNRLSHYTEFIWLPVLNICLLVSQKEILFVFYLKVRSVCTVESILCRNSTIPCAFFLQTLIFNMVVSEIFWFNFSNLKDKTVVPLEFSEAL
jgi:hypothetical protein